MRRLAGALGAILVLSACADSAVAEERGFVLTEPEASDSPAHALRSIDDPASTGTAHRDPETVLHPAAPPGVAEKPADERPPRQVVTYFFETDASISQRQTVIGNTKIHIVERGETFLDIARRYDLGYNEIIAANPHLDPWIPPQGAEVLIPSEWILPRGPTEGIVLNIPEMRLYYYLPSPRGDAPSSMVVTYPVGLGRQDWQTPQAEFRIRGKTKNPTWVIPQSIKQERIEQYGSSEDAIPGGNPDNPLGKYRIELTLPSYAIHGTNKEWGVGMQVSHGCVRMYPEDIEAFFPLVQIGAPGHFVYQPIKVGVRAGRVLVEVHDDIYGVAPWPWMLAQDLIKEMGLERYVDRERLEAVVEAANGIPTDVSYAAWPKMEHVAPATASSE